MTKRRAALLAFVLALAMVTTAIPATSAPAHDIWTEQARIAPDDVPGHDFGSSMDTDGDTLVVGDTGGADHRGHAFVYRETADGYQRTATLSSGNEDSIYFGESVAIDGDTIVVGDRRGGNEPAPGPYIFERDAPGEWTLAFVIDPPEWVESRYGDAVAIDGDTLVLGVADAHPAADRGAYVYERASDGSWELVAHLGHDEDRPSRYGRAIDLDGDRIAIGSVHMGEEKDGGVDLFQRTEDGWVFEQRVRPPIIAGDSLGAENAGQSVALSGDRLLVGDPTALGGGAAFLYEQALSGEWVLEDTLRPAFDSLLFGWSVSLGDGRALVGDPGSAEVGGAFPFEPADGEWQQTGQLVPEEVQRWDFGATVQMHGERTLVADPDAKSVGGFTGPGTVFAFEQALRLEPA
jgi:hypothetical protein